MKDIRYVIVTLNDTGYYSFHIGAKSIGEMVINTPCPAIAEEARQATVMVYSALPITAEKF